MELMADQKTSYIIVGYVPLMYDYALWKGMPPLQFSPKQMDKLAKKMDRFMENAPMPSACLWSKGDKGIGPVFLIEQGEKVADHLRWYAEEKPAEWFQAFTYQEKERYHIALMPKPDKMRERYAKRLLLQYGRVLEPDAKFTFVCKPLHFYSAGKPSVEIPTGKTIPVGILPTEWVDMKKLVEEIREGRPIEKDPIVLGEFELNPYDMSGYFKGGGNEQ